jgi:hypothetical protein
MLGFWEVAPWPQVRIWEFFTPPLHKESISTIVIVVVIVARCAGDRTSTLQMLGKYSFTELPSLAPSIYFFV